MGLAGSLYCLWFLGFRCGVLGLPCVEVRFLGFRAYHVRGEVILTK